MGYGCPDMHRGPSPESGSRDPIFACGDLNSGHAAGRGLTAFRLPSQYMKMAALEHHSKDLMLGKFYLIAVVSGDVAGILIALQNFSDRWN